jgi:hypothetical protein
MSSQICLWNNLAPEILDNVFEHLQAIATLQNRSVFKQCRLVCKSWDELARKHMFQQVCFQSAIQLQQFNQQLESSMTSIGKYVKTVHLDNRNAGLESRRFGLVEPTIGSNLLEGFERMLTLCPNITEIYVPGWYAGYVNQVILDAHNKDFCSYLESIPEKGYIDSGGNIQKCQELDHKFHQDYLELTYKLRKTLRVLHLLRNNNESDETLLAQLKQYPRLYNLTVTLTQPDTLNCIKKYLDYCPELKNLKIIGKEEFRTSYWTQKEFSACPNIKSGYFTGMPPTEKLLEFVMNTFVNLDKLYLKTYKRRQEPINMKIDFLEYALSRKETFVSPIAINNIADVLTSYFQTSNNLDQIFEIGYTWDLDRIPKMYLNDYKFEWKLCTPPPKKRIMVNSLLYVGNGLPPFLKIIQDIGARLKYFLLGTDVHNFRQDVEQYPGQYLDYIFKYCTSLTTFLCRHFILPVHCNEEEMVINTSISSLQLQGCTLSPRALPVLSMRLPNLKHLLLTNITLCDLGENNLKNTLNYTLEMPNSTLNSLEFERDLSKVKDIYIKVVRPSKTLFYVYDLYSTKITSSTDNEFNLSWEKNESSLSFHIQCLNIQSFRISLSSGYIDEMLVVEFSLGDDCHHPHFFS